MYRLMAPPNLTVGHKDYVSNLLNNMRTLVLGLKFLIIDIIITTVTLFYILTDKKRLKRIR